MLTDLHTSDDAQLLSLIKEGDRMAFTEVYTRYWDKLFGYVYNRLHDIEASEEVVQEVFVALWSKREVLAVTTALSPYLFSAVKHRMLNALRATKVREKYAVDFKAFMETPQENPTEQQQNVADIHALIEQSLTDLPEKCQTIYRMSRQQHIPNQEIADTLGISKKTVENNLAQALGHLRGVLKRYDF